MRGGTLTRLRILVEFAKNQPRVRQSDVADAVDISPQAVSKYVSELEAEGLLASGGRSQYTVTQEGIEWMSRMARELKGYADSVLGDVIGGERLWTAVADDDFEEGEEVFLEIRDGVLCATRKEASARGVTVSEASRGDDIGVEHEAGIVDLSEGSVTVFVVPDVSEGGSDAYEGEVPEGPLGAVGTEALVLLRKAEKEPDFYFSADEASAAAAIHGIDVSLFVSRSRLPGVLRTLEGEEVEFEVVDEA